MSQGQGEICGASQLGQPRLSSLAGNRAGAAVVGQSLLKALGDRRDVESASVRAAKDEWERAYTLPVRAYAEVQAAVEYLRRHEGDAVELAPSLFSARKAARNPVVVVTEPANPPKELPKS